MEFANINPRGYAVTVIFTGPKYFFFSRYAGVFAVAERVNIRENCGTDKQDFALVYGNDHLLGGSLGGSQAAAVARAYIRKNENRYTRQHVSFVSEVYEDLSRRRLDVNLI